MTGDATGDRIDDTDGFLLRSIAALARLRADADACRLVDGAAALVAGAMRGGGKLLVCGNGGSAADAQHLATEFVVRLQRDRPGLPALALTVDSSVLTACGNDYGFERVFARQVDALGRAGDVLLAISTSGHSPNVLAALDAARALGLATVGLTGAGGGAMGARCDLLLRAPSGETAIVQQVHITVAHLLCAKVEVALFSNR